MAAILDRAGADAGDDMSIMNAISSSLVAVTAFS